MFGCWARRNPPNVVNSALVDYDARKVIAFLKTRCFCALIHPTINAPIPVMPRRALAVLSGTARRGAAGSRTLPEGQGCPFWQTPIKTTERRKQVASGGRFFWILFFGQAKKSISPAGARTGIRITVAVATL